ncbi:unnamed protein product [Dovyalis caffra]|uniref:Uncharacterized protein n=1 Tax=Dovyalis caffra TaxID=77055 RepID=A0AAV1RKU7_9ROSI|nr:unnamed protein product [Dovyalis caffra]
MDSVIHAGLGFKKGTATDTELHQLLGIIPNLIFLTIDHISPAAYVVVLKSFSVHYGTRWHENSSITLHPVFLNYEVPFDAPILRL